MFLVHPKTLTFSLRVSSDIQEHCVKKTLFDNFWRAVEALPKESTVAEKQNGGSSITSTPIITVHCIFFKHKAVFSLNTHLGHVQTGSSVADNMQSTASTQWWRKHRELLQNAGSPAK